MYFVDFNARAHSVYHAVAPAGPPALTRAAGRAANRSAAATDRSRASANPPEFVYAGVALAQPGLVPNDLKQINGHWVMGLHHNSQEVFTSVVRGGGGGGGGGEGGGGGDDDEPPTHWPNTTTLFRHFDTADFYIVSLGLVVDAESRVLRGALYGAGAVPQLDNNRVFAAWLQRRAVFRTAAGGAAEGVVLGANAQAHGPRTVVMPTQNETAVAGALTGKWFLYDADYVDEGHPGTLLAVSPTVEVSPGDCWEVVQSGGE